MNWKPLLLIGPNCNTLSQQLICKHRRTFQPLWLITIKLHFVNSAPLSSLPTQAFCFAAYSEWWFKSQKCLPGRQPRKNLSLHTPPPKLEDSHISSVMTDMSMAPLHISLHGHHFSTDYLSNHRPSGGMHHSMLRSSIFSRQWTHPELSTLYT